jgi:hypothetical protein
MPFTPDQSDKYILEKLEKASAKRAEEYAKRQKETPEEEALRKEKQRAYYRKHRDKMQNSTKEWESRKAWSPEKLAEWEKNRADRAVEAFKNARRTHMLASAKKRAKEAGLSFNLDISDIMIPENCPVLGIPIYFGDVANRENSPSVDRIHPERGYVKGNTIVISFRANRLRNNATVEELRRIADFYEKLLAATNSLPDAPEVA